VPPPETPGFDAAWYLAIAQHGYEVGGRAAFFLFGTLLAICSSLFAVWGLAP
jgi:hypothetical protein